MNALLADDTLQEGDLLYHPISDMIFQISSMHQHVDKENTYTLHPYSDLFSTDKPVTLSESSLRSKGFQKM